MNDRKIDFNFPIIDLRNNNACNSNASNRYVDFIRNDGRDANRRTELTNENIQDPYSNAPIIDLTQDNDQFLNNGIPFIDLTQDNDQFLNNGIPFIDLTQDNDHNDQFLNNGIPFIDLTQDNDLFLNNGIPVPDLTQDNDQFLNNRIPIIDLTDDPVQDIAAQIQCIDLTDDEASNHNYTNLNISNINDTYTNASRELIDLTEDNNDDSNTDISAVDLTNANDQIQISRISISGIDRNISGVDLSSPSRSEKIQNTASNFMKRADHPIPLRHSLGRSTVNTSKNIPIEITEDAEGHSRTLTVSSIIRRKISKSSKNISKEHLPNSSEPSTSKAKTFSFDDFKEFFQKLWSLLFYWIFKVIILRFIEYYSK